MKATAIALALMLACLPGPSVRAEPGKTIRLVVPAQIGGSGDFLSRIVAKKLQDTRAYHVVVDDRPGLGGVVGADLVAKAVPDGRTLLMASTAHVANPFLHPTAQYDPINDFSPVSMVATIPAVMAVHPSLPVRSVRELMAFARARPHAVEYASEGVGSEMQLSALMFAAMAGLHLTAISYKSRAQAMIDTLSGQVSLIFGNVVSVMPHARSDRLRVLAVTGARRAIELPEVPTIAEAGLPGYEATTWFALLAPAKTPGTVVNRLSSEVIAVLQSPDLRQHFRAQGADVVASSPGELGDHMRSEYAKWGKVLAHAGTKAD